MVISMTEWATEGDEESIYFIDDGDKLVLVIEGFDFSYSCLLERTEVESLVRFLSEWSGFPLFLDSASNGEYE